MPRHHLALILAVFGVVILPAQAATVVVQNSVVGTTPAVLGYQSLFPGPSNGAFNGLHPKSNF
jgi:hypothetical protein